MLHISSGVLYMKQGGKIAGAGRSTKEPSSITRNPESTIDFVKKIVNNGESTLPLYSCSVKAGFPSPADDYIEDYLDLNEFLIKHPAATFIVRASGDSMKGAAIHDGDLLIVDRSIEPMHGKIVIAAVDSELTVKRLFKKGGIVKLVPENSAYPEIIIQDFNEAVIWGVVINIIKQV
jgi:DNA polymerase V